MKKIICVVLCAAVVLAFSSCGEIIEEVIASGIIEEVADVASNVIDAIGGNENLCGICYQEKTCTLTSYLDKDLYVCDDCLSAIGEVADAVEEAFEAVSGAIADESEG